MHRMKSDRSLEVISVDIAGIMNGKTPDIPLKENDVLFIPTRQEKIVERTLTIRGEVQYPGVYQYADNETLEDFVLQAGGLTDKASTVNVMVSRRVMDAKLYVQTALSPRPTPYLLKTASLSTAPQVSN